MYIRKIKLALYGMNLFKKRIYMDHASTTPVLADVRKEMDKYWSKDFYNPASIYEEGRRVKNILSKLRLQVARILSVGSKDIVFTSGGTESNNLAILGTFEVAKERIKKPHVIISAIEHPSVVEAVLEVERRGGRVSVVPVDEWGRVKPSDVEKLIGPSTFLVSIMLANNELGTVEPVAKIGRVVKEKRRDNGYPYFHTDASQAPNYLPINIETLHVDMLTLDASKIYGPKGAGLLVVRPRVSIRPIIIGGGQEKGLRSGTSSLALTAGLVKALEIAQSNQERESQRLKVLRQIFLEEVISKVPQAIVNTPEDNSLPNIVSISLPGLIAELIVLKLDKEGVMVSAGSTCSLIGDDDGSDVIRAIGKPELASATIRFSFGRSTTEKDVRRVVEIFSRKALL